MGIMPRLFRVLQVRRTIWRMDAPRMEATLVLMDAFILLRRLELQSESYMNYLYNPFR